MSGERPDGPDGIYWVLEEGVSSYLVFVSGPAVFRMRSEPKSLVAAELQFGERIPDNDTLRRQRETLAGRAVVDEAFGAIRDETNQELHSRLEEEKAAGEELHDEVRRLRGELEKANRRARNAEAARDSFRGLHQRATAQLHNVRKALDA